MHDNTGNRTQTKAGGDQSGAGLRPANYSANNLNQYSSRDVPAAIDVMGLGFATNAVTVNGQAAFRKGEYFRAEVPISNGSTSVWQSVSVAATNQTTVSGNVYVPKNQEQFYYDLDGNLTNDGRWAYTWDAENRLAKMAPNTSIGPRNSLKFEYDWQGRRIHKQVWGNTNWTSTPTNDVKFVYDGWNLIAILNSSFSLQTSFMWGLDLAGSLQGAGGVGGLLEVTYKGAQATNCFVAFDGNGNITALADAGSTNILAQYEYGPFGELLRATGPMAKANPFRFSTKYQDDETDQLYYGYRYYSPSTGRWQSRDPKGEDGGRNLYAFVANAPVGKHDAKGLECQCDSASVWIFFEQNEEVFDGHGLLQELERVVPQGLGVYWHLSPLRPAGSHLGWQGGGWWGGTYGNCLYYMQIRIRHSVQKPMDYFGALDVWGYGNEWEANAYPDRVRYDLEEYNDRLPDDWQKKSAQQAWMKYSAWILAHELVHGIGVGHSSQRGTLMYRRGDPDWLDRQTIPVDPRTSFQVRSILLQKSLGNVTN